MPIPKRDLCTEGKKQQKTWAQILTHVKLEGRRPAWQRKQRKNRHRNSLVLFPKVNLELISFQDVSGSFFSTVTRQRNTVKIKSRCRSSRVVCSRTLHIRVSLSDLGFGHGADTSGDSASAGLPDRGLAGGRPPRLGASARMTRSPSAGLSHRSRLRLCKGPRDSRAPRKSWQVAHVGPGPCHAPQLSRPATNPGSSALGCEKQTQRQLLR